MTATAVSHAQYRPKLLLFAAAAVVLMLLALLPPYIGLYQTQLLTYGLIAAIAALYLIAAAVLLVKPTGLFGTAQ